MAEDARTGRERGSSQGQNPRRLAECNDSQSVNERQETEGGGVTRERSLTLNRRITGCAVVCLSTSRERASAGSALKSALQPSQLILLRIKQHGGKAGRAHRERPTNGYWSIRNTDIDLKAPRQLTATPRRNVCNVNKDLPTPLMCSFTCFLSWPVSFCSYFTMPRTPV